jgi:hypothetical protein
MVTLPSWHAFDCIEKHLAVCSNSSAEMRAVQRRDYQRHPSMCGAVIPLPPSHAVFAQPSAHS